jgi:hypothetical protein
MVYYPVLRPFFNFSFSPFMHYFLRQR